MKATKLNIEDDDEDEESSKKKKDEEDDPTTKGYNYLMNLNMWKLTHEQKQKLLDERDQKLKELKDLREKTPSDLYIDDLDAFMEALDKLENGEKEDEKDKPVKKSVVSKKGTVRKSLPEYAPSPKGERVAPRIDEMMKKAEQATKAKEKKGTRPKKNVRPNNKCLNTMYYKSIQVFLIEFSKLRLRTKPHLLKLTSLI